jgi:hypothetical protein
MRFPLILTRTTMRYNVVLCGRPTLTVDMARRWRPVRTSYGLDCNFPFEQPVALALVELGFDDVERPSKP